MRHLAKLALGGLSAALLATACGGATSVLQGKTPEQIIQLASTKVTGESYRMAMTADMSVDASGVQGMPATMLDAMTSAMKNFSMDGKGEVQDPQRVGMTMSISVAGEKKQMAVVLYDGHYYISMNNDGKYADAGSLNLEGVNASPSDIKRLLTGAVDVKDLGATVHDGQRVEHLHANFGANYIQDQLDKITGSGSGASAIQQITQLLKDVFTVKDGGLDVYVRDVDGRVEAVVTDMTMAIDMGKFMSLLMQQYGGKLGTGSQLGSISGSMLMKINGTDRFSDYGAKITVSKPAVDPNAPGLPGNLFGA